MSQTADATKTCIVYFDGGCPVCAREIAVYRRLQPAHGAAAFVDVSQTEAAPAADLDHATALARLHVRLADGTLVSGARAFIALWRTTPRLRWVGIVAATPPLPFLLELGYRGFLRLRPLWRR